VRILGQSISCLNRRSRICKRQLVHNDTFSIFRFVSHELHQRIKIGGTNCERLSTMVGHLVVNFLFGHCSTRFGLFDLLGPLHQGGSIVRVARSPTNMRIHASKAANRPTVVGCAPLERIAVLFGSFFFARWMGRTTKIYVKTLGRAWSAPCLDGSG
jgi:hypothetical protein